MGQDDDLGRRSAQEVLDDHLALAASGDWRTDLERNVADDIVVLTGFGAFEGRDQIRVLAELLDAQLPDAASSTPPWSSGARWATSNGGPLPGAPG